MTRRQRPLARRWGWPVALAALTIGGLLFALLGNSDFWRAMSWIALSIPLLIILRHWPLRRLFKRKHAP